METKILRVVRQGEAFSVQSSKSDNGSIQKCNIVLRELGGSRSAEGRLHTHEYQGQVFQEILATDIVKLNN